MIPIVMMLLLAGADERPWPQEPKAYRGIEWGAPYSKADATVGRFDSCRCAGKACPDQQRPATDGEPPLPPPNDTINRVCTSHVRLGDVSVMERFIFERGKLAAVSMDFSSSDYDALKAAFLSTYGAPARVEAHEVTNGVGEKLKNESLVWRGPNAGLTLSRLGDSTRYGAATLSTRVYADRLERERGPKSKMGMDAF
jgi:hypothetical protein